MLQQTEESLLTEQDMCGCRTKQLWPMGRYIKMKICPEEIGVPNYVFGALIVLL
jgi:hypothetical protein